MQNILLLGAGRSATYLINYLAKVVQKNQWNFSIAEANAQLLAEKIAPYPFIEAYQLNILDKNQTTLLIQKADVVISLLPPALHTTIAHLCLEEKKHLLTASYLTPEVKKMDAEVQQKDLLFLYEMGLDPGIDHLSAKKMIDEIQQKEGQIFAFQSFCGGLIAPEYDNNPWNYKFTWNPQNVILAGQGGAKFKQNAQFKYVPYHQLFKRILPINMGKWGAFEAYYNRNSLQYLEAYNLQNCPTVIRGTIRRKGFSEAWNAFVQLGLTDNSFVIENIAELTFSDFIEAFLPEIAHYQADATLEEKVAQALGVTPDSEIIQKLAWTGIFEQTPIGLTEATPAQVLQHLLEPRWQLEPQDCDMVVMQHQLSYVFNKETYQTTANLVVKGENPHLTAMAKTVGLPLAMAAELLMQGKIKTRGVQIPVFAEIYEPILKLLAQENIFFEEETTSNE